MSAKAEATPLLINTDKSGSHSSHGSVTVPVTQGTDELTDENLLHTIPENQEGTFSGCCLHCSKVSKHRKKIGKIITIICGPILMFLALGFLAITAASIVGMVRLCKDESSFEQTIYLSNQSVIEVDPVKCNIDTLKHQVTVKCSTLFEGSITASIDNNVTWKKFPLPLETVTTHNESLLRYWDNEHPPTGAIGIYGDNNYIVWSWSSLTGPPLAQNCSKINTTWSDKHGVIDVSEIYEKRRVDDELVMISFCSDSENDPIEAHLSITEYQPVPDTTKNRPLYCKKAKGEVTLKFPSVFSELLNPSKIYIDTTHLTDRDNEPSIDLEVVKYNKGCGISVAAVVVSLFLAIIFPIVYCVIIAVYCRRCKT